jgi:hypothetical protein
MGVVTRGDHEISLRFDQFPQELQGKLEERIRALTAELDARVEAATPVKTGLLRSEIKSNVYAAPTRVAGYVSVFAGSLQSEYVKAATLEYGSNKVRQLRDRLNAGHRRLEGRLSKAAHIEAFRYLRDPFEQMRPEIDAALEAVVAEAAAEEEA